MSDFLQIHQDKSVLRIRLNRPEVHNAFDDQLIAELTAAFDKAAFDESVRVVVLESEGHSFSAGADLNWMRGVIRASEEQNIEDSTALARLMRAINSLPKPTVARVQGAAFGGGVGLVACCDIAIGTPNAIFALSEARLGLLPAVISPYVIEAIGARQARRYFATGERFSAEKAYELGLLHELVEPHMLDKAVDEMVQKLLDAGPVATGSAKQLINLVVSTTDAVAQDEANSRLIARLRVSPEGQEGLTAFLEKRKPSWMEQ